MTKINDDAIFRFSIISQLLHQKFQKGELKKKLQELASHFYMLPSGEYKIYSFKTLEEWYYKYRNHGLPSLSDKKRIDIGISRSIDPEISEEIIEMKLNEPGITVPKILKHLMNKGMVTKNEVSRSSVYRLLKDMDNLKLNKSRDGKQIKKYSFPFVNGCWQCDVCHGSYFKIKGSPKKKKIFIFAFIDDASRVITHAGIALRENSENFIAFLKTAIRKRGVPEMIYTDNARYFKNHIIQTIGKNTKIKIIYCPPYSPNKKGKIERWFRTFRDQFLDELDREKKYTLTELNDLLSTWVERDYHHNFHNSLQKTPIQAWTEKSKNIKTLDNEFIEKNFLAQKIRKVRNDGTISLNGKIYEVDSCLAGNKVSVRYNPFKTDKIHVYFNDKFLQDAFPVDEKENQLAVRKPSNTHEYKWRK